MSDLPDCFALSRGWADAVKLETLIESIQWTQTPIRVFGREVMQPRLTCWMGEAAYTYSGRRHEPAPMPPIVETIRTWVEATTRTRYNSVLANMYRTGSDSVSWHADDEPELGTEPTIASLSFGAPRAFKIRRWSEVNPAARRPRVDSWTLELGHGDLLVMSGPAQRDYQHAVPKTARPIGARVNLTFRAVTK